MSEAIERSINEAETLFVNAGRAKVQAEAMDLRRKRVRATLFVKYKGEGNAAGASEQMAEADPVYELACADWESAALEAETLRAQAEAKRMTVDDLVSGIQMGQFQGKKTAKITMKNGRTLTTLIQTDGKWLSDTIWFR